MSSFADILQITDVAHRVIFLLFLQSFYAVVQLFCTAVSKHTISSPRLLGSQSIFLAIIALLLTFFSTYRKRLPNLVNASWL